jgi:hypothetical protein
MKKLALAATALGALTFACGDDGGGVIQLPDGGGVGCDEVAQTGCADNEKCAFILQNPDTGSGILDCITNGDKALGDACTPPTEVGAADDCAGAGFCHNGTCRQVCRDSGSCDNGMGDCAQNFVDGAGNQLPLGWCLDGCNPLANEGAGDCVTENENCYISLTPAGGTCIRPAGGGPGVPVGDECQFSNSCERGSACIGPQDGPSFCRGYCGTVEQMYRIAENMIAGAGPRCCGADCVDDTVFDPIAELACGADNEMCALIGIGGGQVHGTTGFCQTDEDATSETRECDCALSPIDADAPDDESVCTAIEDEARQSADPRRHASPIGDKARAL